MSKKDRYDHYEEGKHDAERDRGAGITDLLTLGLVSDSSYDPPKGAEDREAYQRGWDAVKKGR